MGSATPHSHLPSSLFPLLLALVGVTGGGCGGDSEAEALCKDAANVLADAWDRCGYDRESKHTEVMDGLRGCKDVTSIRDKKALADECFPALATLDCTRLVEDILPQDCQWQILF